MKVMESRKLNALGYQLGPKLKVPGLEVVTLENQSGQQMLLIGGLVLGPTWPQIYLYLSKLNPPPRFVSVGKTPFVLIEDSSEARRLLELLPRDIRANRGLEVHIEDVGFVELEAKSVRQVRSLLLPAATVVGVFVLGILWKPPISPGTDAKTEETGVSCIVDASKAEFDQWLSRALISQQTSQGQVLEISTGLAQIELTVESTIGSAARVSGIAVCEDGRELVINHRVDVSGTGTLLELGQ
jgi:hypothetical protein